MSEKAETYKGLPEACRKENSCWRERLGPAKMPGGGSQTCQASCKPCRELPGFSFHASSPCWSGLLVMHLLWVAHVPVSNHNKFTGSPHWTFVVSLFCSVISSLPSVHGYLFLSSPEVSQIVWFIDLGFLWYCCAQIMTPRERDHQRGPDCNKQSLVSKIQTCLELISIPITAR